jgi:hypothetical protein
MSFTRFHDDPNRIKKQLQESTDQGRWVLDTPGNGDKPCYMSDPYIRPQKWAGNLRTNPVNIESDLKGLSRKLNNDCIGINNYKNNIASSSEVSYPVSNEVTQQPRATHPAWEVRELEQNNWNYLLANPQENTNMSFQHNINTRILEKDYYEDNIPCVNNMSYGSVKSIGFN